MFFSKLLLLSAKNLNGVGYKVGRRLLASEASIMGSNKKCEDKGPLTISVKEAPKDRHALVLGVYRDEKGHLELSPRAKEIDKSGQGILTRHLNLLGPDFDVGKAVVITERFKHDDKYVDILALTCVGPKDFPGSGFNKLEAIYEGMENARWANGAAVKQLDQYGWMYEDGDPSLDHQTALQEAWQLSTWLCDSDQATPQPQPSPRRKTSAASTSEAAGKRRKTSSRFQNIKKPEGLLRSREIDIGNIMGEAQNWARYLSEMPANRMAPMDVGEEARKKLCPLGVDVQVHGRDWITSLNMQAFLTVANGSCQEPVFLECNYKGDSSKNTVILLAGKGLTFDSGGLCLKKPMDMLENRASMAGASAVLGALLGIAKLKLKMNVVAVIPLCENMISGQSMKVGDVVPALNGVNIQIEDTDMEGRLMLADALVYGQAKYKPSVTIDVATLTRGITTATGGGCFGCFSNSDALWKCAEHAGAVTGDRPWRFPLWNYYRKQVTDDPSVDLRNRGSGRGTPCIGAAFLQQFVCTDWLHFDVTGVGKIAHNPPPYLHAHRMSGRPTRTLIKTLENIIEQQNNQQEPPVKDE